MKHEFYSVGDNTWKYNHFDYVPTEIYGVGKNRMPFVNMDPYIGTSPETNWELHLEVIKGIAMLDNFTMGHFVGDYPEEFKTQGENWTTILKNIEQYDPTGEHRKNLEEVVTRSSSQMEKVRRINAYCIAAFGACMSWHSTFYLKTSNWANKGTAKQSQWTHVASHFPKLLKYIATLPFKEVGRIVLFNTFPTVGVIPHRDSVIQEHTDHNINLFLHPGGRPSFVYDCIQQKKSYLDPKATSYFFNNRDYHGVDPTPEFRYTVRIDGTFTDELAEKLKLENGYTWKWDYIK
jgi:hypothetical protein